MAFAFKCLVKAIWPICSLVATSRQHRSQIEVLIRASCFLFICWQIFRLEFHTQVQDSVLSLLLSNKLPYVNPHRRQQTGRQQSTTAFLVENSFPCPHSLYAKPALVYEIISYQNRNSEGMLVKRNNVLRYFSSTQFLKILPTDPSQNVLEYSVKKHDSAHSLIGIIAKQSLWEKKNILEVTCVKGMWRLSASVPIYQMTKPHSQYTATYPPP